jgi:hypothetical protein
VEDHRRASSGSARDYSSTASSSCSVPPSSDSSSRFSAAMSSALAGGYAQPTSGNPSIVVVLWGGIGIAGVAVMVIMDMLVARAL